MTLSDLLLDLGRAGVTLRAAGDRLGFTPRQALTPGRADAIRAHRGAVLGLLVNGYAPETHGDTDAAYVLGERLGIADGLGMPTHPGSAAWLVAVGEAMAGLDKSSSCATLDFNGRAQDRSRVHPA